MLDYWHVGFLLAPDPLSSSLMEAAGLYVGVQPPTNAAVSWAPAPTSGTAFGFLLLHSQVSLMFQECFDLCLFWHSCDPDPGPVHFIPKPLGAFERVLFLWNRLVFCALSTVCVLLSEPLFGPFPLSGVSFLTCPLAFSKPFQVHSGLLYFFPGHFVIVP